MIQSDDRMTVTSLKENDWLSLRSVVSPLDGITGYVYSHETRCKGKILAVLGVRYDPEVGEREYLIREEVTPCWGLKPELSALTGGWEGVDIIADAVKELEEEAGYKVDRSSLKTLGTCFGTKSTDTTFYLYTVDLSGLERGEALGDGSKQDSEGEAHWMTYGEVLTTVQDPIVLTMIARYNYFYG